MTAVEHQSPEHANADLCDSITSNVEDSCPAWCEGCDDDGMHVTDYAGVDGAGPENDALARLRQESDGPALVELGVNDADGGSAAIRMTLEKARELADLLNDLVASANA